MTRLFIIRRLLTPSFAGGVLCIVVAAVIVAFVAWSYIVQNQLFYDYLFGRYGSATVFVTAPDNFVALRRALFNSSTTYFILLFALATIIGLLVYALLQGFGHATKNISTLWRELRQHDSAATAALEESLGHLAARIFSLVGWALYFAFFMTILLPIAVVMVNGGTADVAAGSPSGWLFISGGFAFLALGLHLHVIFARLSFLRLRLFKSNDIPLQE